MVIIPHVNLFQMTNTKKMLGHKDLDSLPRFVGVTY